MPIPSQPVGTEERVESDLRDPEDNLVFAYILSPNANKPTLRKLLQILSAVVGWVV